MFVELVRFGILPYLEGLALPALIAMVLLVRRGAVRPWFSALTLAPFLTWCLAGQLCVLFGRNRGTLSNLAFEPLALGLVTGLLLLPVSTFASGEPTAVRRQVLVALLLGAGLGAVIGSIFPPLVE